MSDTHHPNYIRIWAILCVLLVISIAGPALEIRVVTLITAFGIAIVKAWLVVRNFMHLNAQPRYVGYLLATAVAFMVLLFAGSAADIMNDEGAGWDKPSYAYQDRVGESSHAGENGEAH